VADKVITQGDLLFGSTVTGTIFSRGLNNNDQIAFEYILADGRKGLADATPISDPILEPLTITLLGICLVGLAGAEVRRRQKKKAVDKS